MTDTTGGSADHQATIALKHAQSQRWLAFALFLFSFIILGWVASEAITCEKCDEDNRVQLVFTTVTTLVGTWVGTLLAFYFTRENFEAASRSMQRTIDRLSPDERLHSVKIEEAMILRGSMKTFDLKADQMVDAVLLSELVAKFAEDETVSRLPILDAKGAVVAIIHESLLNKFLQENPNLTAPTLANIGADRQLGPKLKLFGVVARDRTLRDAKTAMESQTGCKDVFVTPSGGASENVVGWITDGRILAALDA